MALQRVVDVIRTYPLIRGMASYGLIWPCSNLMQQTVIEDRDFSNYDYVRAMRFCIYATVIQSPTLYFWVRATSIVWPRPGLVTAIKKAFSEQVAFEPASIALFYVTMSLMEGKSLQEAREVTNEKFLPTFKVSLCFWPIFQTFNFYYVKEANRVPVVSLASFGWSCFLAYMHHTE